MVDSRDTRLVLASASPRLVLASASPRRADLLKSMGLQFDIVVSNIDETERPNEAAHRYVERLAREKADVGIVLAGADAVVVAADTCVVRDTHILGKPRNAAEARTMLQSLSGRSHDVFTGVAVAYRDRRAHAIETTTVTFGALSDSTIDWFISTGEAFDKAGGYGMQSYGGVFVERINGSPSNVVGLPLHTVVALCVEIGIDIHQFRPAWAQP